MSGWRQTRWRLAMGAAGLWTCLAVAAQTAAPLPAPAPSLVPAGLIPPKPQLHSPVDSLRKLLAMTPRERMIYLTNRTPEVRQAIFAKIREYQGLDPNERELRLRATDLRWYLLPLLRESPDNRAAQLAAIPEEMRALVQSRLAVWDALAPESRQEFLDNEQTLRYLTHLEATDLPPGAGQNRWDALSDSERKTITDQFSRFFDLTDAEKEEALNTLSDAERAQMKQTLTTFDQLPPAQRRECIRAFTEFASMSPTNRAEFLKNAERWSQMSPKERQAWRDLVAQVPLWPPAQIPLPPPPNRLPPRLHPAVATNFN